MIPTLMQTAGGGFWFAFSAWLRVLEEQQSVSVKQLTTILWERRNTLSSRWAIRRRGNCGRRRQRETVFDLSERIATK